MRKYEMKRKEMVDFNKWLIYKHETPTPKIQNVKTYQIMLLGKNMSCLTLKICNIKFFIMI